MQSHQLGGRLGRYVLKHEVATGGMATVYLAQLEGAREVLLRAHGVSAGDTPAPKIEEQMIPTSARW